MDTKTLPLTATRKETSLTKQFSSVDGNGYLHRSKHSGASSPPCQMDSSPFQTNRSQSAPDGEHAVQGKETNFSRVPSLMFSFPCW